MTPTQSPTNPHAAGKAAHSPLPWSVRASRNDEGYGLLICDEDQTILAGMDTWLGPTPEAEMEANAAFIVRACNSHAALVEALEAADLRITACATAFYVDGNRKALQSALEGWKVEIKQLRAALSSATLEATP